METLGISKTAHDHVDLLAPQLRLNTLQSTLQAKPEVDFLGRCSRGNVTSEFRHGLDGLDPLVDVTLEGVEEGTVIELLGRKVGDARSCTRCASLFNDALDNRMDDEMRLRNLHILL